jgi:hypothetical protein
LSPATGRTKVLRYIGSAAGRPTPQDTARAQPFDRLRAVSRVKPQVQGKAWAGAPTRLPAGVVRVRWPAA